MQRRAHHVRRRLVQSRVVFLRILERAAVFQQQRGDAGVAAELGGSDSTCPPPFALQLADLLYCVGAAVAAFHCMTTEAVVIVSVFLNPATGAFDRRTR